MNDGATYDLEKSKPALLGFRTNRVWKKILSVIYLVFCALFALGTSISGRQEQITVYDFWIDKLYCFVLLLMLLSPYIFLSNTKYRDKLPLFKRHNGWLSFIGMIIVVFAIAIVSGLVNNLHSKEYMADMKNHAYVEVSSKAATCETNGKIEYHCEYCGQDTVETINALGHKWDEGKETRAATCETDGTTTYTCVTCNGTKTEKINATGHKMKQVSEDEEKIVYKCEICGKEKIEFLEKKVEEEKEPTESKVETSSQEKPTESKTDSVAEASSEKETVDIMISQFKDLGFTETEAKEMKEIFTTVGITELNNIQAGGGTGIDTLQAFKSDIYDSRADRGGISIHFTIDKRQLCFISLDGIATTQVDYAYINIFGNVKFKTSNGKKSVTLYDIWDENGEIIPDAIGYKAVLDYENKKITEYEN